MAYTPSRLACLYRSWRSWAKTWQCYAGPERASLEPVHSDCPTASLSLLAPHADTEPQTIRDNPRKREDSCTSSLQKEKGNTEIHCIIHNFTGFQSNMLHFGNLIKCIFGSSVHFICWQTESNCVMCARGCIEVYWRMNECARSPFTAIFNSLNSSNYWMPNWCVTYSKGRDITAGIVTLYTYI